MYTCTCANYLEREGQVHFNINVPFHSQKDGSINRILHKKPSSSQMTSSISQGKGLGRGEGSNFQWPLEQRPFITKLHVVLCAVLIFFDDIKDYWCCHFWAPFAYYGMTSGKNWSSIQLVSTPCPQGHESFANRLPVTANNLHIYFNNEGNHYLLIKGDVHVHVHVQELCITIIFLNFFCFFLLLLH